ncbi:MAG: hypothetical protein DRI24_16340 [Deltaproteobacteria bacterium]|nr:MAG: hypothetical protein DRI24_16340 [Deltaproteobacteria bacterium]
MSEKLPVTTTPLVSVNLSEDESDPNYTRIRYFVGDDEVMDMSVEKTYVPSSPSFFPAMALTQLLVTPHHHLALLGEYAAICADISPDAVPVDPKRWKDLIDRTSQLLNPPTDPREQKE